MTLKQIVERAPALRPVHALARSLAVALAVAALVEPVNADASAVAGHTEISGSTTGYAELELREPMTPFPSDGERADFYLNGDGWLRAAELRAVEPAADGHRPSIFLLRLETHHATGDHAMLLAGTRYPGETLPPGRYRFYLWTEPGKQARAYLRFPGLSGAARVSPEIPVPLDQRALATRDGGAPLTTAYGRTGELTSSGWVLLRMRTFSDSPSLDWVETCTYYGGDEAAGARAYQRGCPGGLGHGSESVPQRGEDLIVMGFFDEPVRVGTGGNVSAFGLPPRFAVWSAYFSYGDPDFGAAAPGTSMPPPAVITPTSGSFPMTGSGAGPARGALRLVRSRLIVRKRRALARFHCSTAGPCSGLLRLGARTAFRPVRLRRGERRVVRLRIPSRTHGRLARRGRVRETLVVRGDTPTGVSEQRLRVWLLR